MREDTGRGRCFINSIIVIQLFNIVGLSVLRIAILSHFSMRTFRRTDLTVQNLLFASFTYNRQHI